MADGDHKTRVTVADMALFFVACTLSRYYEFLSELRDRWGQPIDARRAVEILLFVLYAHDLVIQQRGSKGFGVHGRLISRCFRDAMVLFNEATSTFHVESSAWFERTIEDRFEEYYVAMSANDPLVSVGGAFSRRVSNGKADAYVAAMGALHLTAILRFTPSVSQHLVVDPDIREIPRSAIVPTVMSLMSEIRDN